MRNFATGLTGFSTSFPGKEALALDGESTCCTVYAGVDAQPTGQVLRLNLFAELAGTRQLVASAFLVPNFTGPCINVTGLNVDGWHVSVQATSSSSKLKIGIASSTCCAALSVFVPPALREFPLFPGEPVPAMVEPDPAPFELDTGHYDVLSGANGVVPVAKGRRVLRVEAFNSLIPPLPATMTLTRPSQAPVVFTIFPLQTKTLRPRGNLAGPLVLTFTSTETYVIETVR